MKKRLKESIFKRHKEVHEKRHTEHNYGNCIYCNPVIEAEKKNFYGIWKRIEKSLSGLVYTGYSLTTYRSIQEEKEKEEPNDKVIRELVVELDNSITYQVDKYKETKERIEIFLKLLEETDKPLFTGVFPDLILFSRPSTPVGLLPTETPIFTTETESEEEETEMDEETARKLAAALEKLGEHNVVTPVLFYGKEEEDPTEWIRNYNRAAQANRWDESRKMQLVGTFLRGNALHWFEDNEEIFNTKGEDESDEDFLKVIFTRYSEEFIKIFTTREHKRSWRQQLESIKQKKEEKVDTYTNRFKRLWRNIDPERNHEEIYIQRYVDGLKEELAEKVYDRDPETIEDAEKFAKKAETNSNYRKVRKGTKETKEIKEEKDEVIDELVKKFEKMEIKLAEREFRKSSERRSYTCYTCGKEGHVSKNCGRKCKHCGKEGHETEKCFTIRKCNKCNKKGHTESFCDKIMKRINYIDDSEDEREVYISTRSGRNYGGRKKNIPESDEDEDMEVDEERPKVPKVKKSLGKSRFDKLKDYDIGEDIALQRANITIGQLLKLKQQRVNLNRDLRRKFLHELKAMERDDDNDEKVGKRRKKIKKDLKTLEKEYKELEEEIYEMELTDDE